MTHVVVKNDLGEITYESGVLYNTWSGTVRDSRIQVRCTVNMIHHEIFVMGMALACVLIVAITGYACVVAAFVALITARAYVPGWAVYYTREQAVDYFLVQLNATATRIVHKMRAAHEARARRVRHLSPTTCPCA